MAEVVKKPLKITETVLRDAHQSLIATRMTTEQMLPIVDKMDKVGYNAVECWGGATFDASLRFLKEDPWERLRKLRDGFKNTKLQMLFRGQNILGYRPYADDVVEYFVQKSIANGIDIIRIFDCLNDIRNLQTAVTACNKENGHAQVALSYTLGDAYTLEYWMDMAKRVEDMGANSLCIKDMAGLLVPSKATELVQALKDSTSLPIELHTHYTSGVASMTYMKAVEAGCDIIDTAISPFSMGTSQPATEVMVEAFKGTEFDTGLDQNLLAEIADYFRPMREEALESGLMNTKVLGVNIKTLLYQVPGGMLSNLVNQLKEMGMADKYQDHRRIRRRARTHLPHFRGIPGRQGRGNARGGDHGNLSAGRTALFRRMGRDPDDDALRFARVYRGRLLLSDLHDRFAQGKPIGAVHRLLIRHGRSAALHPPQKYRSAEKRHGIQNIHLEAPSKSGQIAR